MSNKFEALKHHPAENSDNDSGDDELGPNITDLGPVEYPPGEHRLQHPYCLWFSRRPSRLQQGTEGYSQSLRLVGQVGTVEQWWALYSHIVRLQDIAPHRDVHLFKKGIMPMWEDPANRKGGKWVIRLRKDYGSRAWENLCLAMLGEQFMAGNEICGVVVSTRYQECLLNIWNRTASDMVTTNRIRDALKRLLNMPASATMEYKVHSDCLKASKTVISNNAFKS
ncbi:eukaryotic translation initiation factor 4E type 2 [Harmonia axyridis]|uniref:eukaryotic translation initiation factor 4E type 2 n=1 Tax=Harmonia axyridis TaxID=115357 RepID=UPI001E277D9B|nr:eukaryotic translation initiation factor 4E type 2 [Harmonia axyridis]